jgi:hypothetical protein
MKLKRLYVSTLTVIGLCFLLLPNLPAQVKGNIVWAEYQEPGVAKAQFENARRKMVQWHRDQNSALPVYVWEVISGERTGQYLVAVSVEDWEVFDKNPFAASAGRISPMSRLEAGTAGVHTFFMDHLMEVSRDSDSKTPAAMAVLRYYKIAYGKWGEFYNLLRKFKEAADEGAWPVHYSWFSVNNGMEEPLFVEAVPKANWAAMAPPQKAPLQLAMDLFGPEETISMTNLMGQVIEEETSEILRYRADLSYFPEGEE